MDFDQIERLIKEDPKKADDLAYKWQEFARQNPETLPTDAETLLGRDIEEVYFYLRDKDEDEQMQTQGQVDPSRIPVEFVAQTALAFAFRNRKKTLEEDKDYQELVKKHKELWLEKNKGKDFTSKEGLDYLYGSLDEEGVPTLKKDAEQEFRNNPRFKKRIERYDKEKKKIYKNLDEDPAVVQTRYEIENHTRDRHAYLKTLEDKRTPEEVSALIQKRSWEKFVAENPEKAKAYAQTNTDIKKAHEKQEIKKQLAEMEQKTGKQIRYVEKTHRPQGMGVEEASRRLESIIPTPPRPIPTEQRTSSPQTGRFFDRSGRTIGGIGRQFGEQGRSFTSGLGRTGTRLISRVGSTAGRVTVGVLTSSPMGWIALGVIAAIFVATVILIILLSEGGGGFGGPKPVPTTECIGPEGDIIIVTNGHTCATNLTDYYTKEEGAPVTARCLDKCTDFVFNSCERNEFNTCTPNVCGAPSHAFCYEYSPPLVPPLKRYRDCNTGGDGYDGTPLGVTSCSGRIADPTITPTPTLTPTPTPTP